MRSHRSRWRGTAIHVTLAVDCRNTYLTMCFYNLLPELRVLLNHLVTHMSRKYLLSFLNKDYCCNDTWQKKPQKYKQTNKYIPRNVEMQIKTTRHALDHGMRFILHYSIWYLAVRHFYSNTILGTFSNRLVKHRVWKWPEIPTYWLRFYKEASINNHVKIIWEMQK